jgi:hypothetical protein
MAWGLTWNWAPWRTPATHGLLYYFVNAFGAVEVLCSGAWALTEWRVAAIKNRILGGKGSRLTFPSSGRAPASRILPLMSNVEQ